MSKSRENASLNLSDNDNDTPKKKKAKNRQLTLLPKAGSVSMKPALKSLSSSLLESMSY